MKKCVSCSRDDIKTYKKNVSSVYSDRPYDLDLCANCGLIFTSPAPDKKTLDDIYKNKYSYDVHLLIQKEKKYRAGKFSGYVKKAGTMTKVLEIGSMYGFLIESLEKSGFKCTGLEIDEKAVEYCQRKNMDVRNETLEVFLEKNEEKFDLVVMSHVLEHIVNPKEYLEKIKSLLSENGKIMIIVPNASSLTGKAFGKYWGYWQVPVHINHFNKKSLRHLFENLNFKTLRIGTAGGDSLLFLSTLANMLGARSMNLNLSPAKKKAVKVFSTITKYWYQLGNDDLIIMAEKK